MTGLDRRDASLSRGLTLAFYSVRPLISTFNFSSLRFPISSCFASFIVWHIPL